MTECKIRIRNDRGMANIVPKVGDTVSVDYDTGPTHFGTVKRITSYPHEGIFVIDVYMPSFAGSVVYSCVEEKVMKGYNDLVDLAKDIAEGRMWVGTVAGDRATKILQDIGVLPRRRPGSNGSSKRRRGGSSV